MFQTQATKPWFFKGRQPEAEGTSPHLALRKFREALARHAELVKEAEAESADNPKIVHMAVGQKSGIPKWVALVHLRFAPPV